MVLVSFSGKRFSKKAVLSPGGNLFDRLTYGEPGTF
jgi:hypothetical protein